MAHREYVNDLTNSFDVPIPFLLGTIHRVIKDIGQALFEGKFSYLLTHIRQILQSAASLTYLNIRILAYCAASVAMASRHACRVLRNRLYPGDNFACAGKCTVSSKSGKFLQSRAADPDRRRNEPQRAPSTPSLKSFLPGTARQGRCCALTCTPWHRAA
jgi:hypothetical protein